MKKRKEIVALLRINLNGATVFTTTYFTNEMEDLWPVDFISVFKKCFV